MFKVPGISTTIAGQEILGSLAVANNKGAMLHPDVTVSEVEKISQRVLKKDLMLDHSINNDDEDNRTPLDFLNDESLNPYEITSNNNIAQNRKKVIGKSLNALNDKEKYIIKKRHLNNSPFTLEAIGKDLKISKERVRQLESRAFSKLKKRILKTSKVQDLI